jgi:16S rRNA (uracil1498-N3)-methyltransferase
MPLRDFTSQRLYLDAPLAAGASIEAAPEQAQYLLSVLRLKPGEAILVFNGRDGEWRATLVASGKRGCRLVVGEQARPQEQGPDIGYLFAPLKRARLDYMVQKAVELGVARLAPVITRHTVPERVNLERMRANAIEAAEQCGILRIPEIIAPVALDKALAARDPARPLVFCDEAAEVASPLDALAGVAHGGVDVLIGPEGGFAEAEREMIRSCLNAHAISLGPRVMRADTAAVAALALVNAVLGDWR